jgi:hypothetical protein
VGGQWVGDRVEGGQLIERSAEVVQRGRGGDDRLGDMALLQVKVLGEHVSQCNGASTGPGLEGGDTRLVSESILLALFLPVLDCYIQVEGLSRVCEDLIREGVRDLLDQSLGGKVGRATDGLVGEVLTKRQTGRLLVEVLGCVLLSTRASGFRLLEMHLECKYAPQQLSLSVEAVRVSLGGMRECESYYDSPGASPREYIAVVDLSPRSSQKVPSSSSDIGRRPTEQDAIHRTRHDWLFLDALARLSGDRLQMRGMSP